MGYGGGGVGGCGVSQHVRSVILSLQTAVLWSNDIPTVRGGISQLRKLTRAVAAAAARRASKPEARQCF